MEKGEQEERDFYCMGKALDFAAYAGAQDEVPVGAVLVSREHELIAGAGNDCIHTHDPTGHAEIHTLRAAAEKLANYRLPQTTMYVTLEPCPMCAAAMIQARVQRIVFGAIDPKGGALQSLYTIGSDGKLNHRFAITGGVRAEECATLLKDFFRRRRKKG